MPALAREALRGLAAELEALDRRVKEIEVAIVRWHKDNEASRRLATIPGVGPITASAIVATTRPRRSPRLGRVGFAALDISCHVSGRHQSHLMPQLPELSRPIMRRASSLNPDQTRR